MKTRTLKLEGRITNVEGHISEYPLGSIESITSGRWELAISNISLIFGRGHTWNTIYEVSTNYIDSVVAGENGIRQIQPMTLTFIRAKGQPGEKVMLGFRWRDFFEISSPSKMFRVTFKEITDPDGIAPAPAQDGSVFVSILILFRRLE